MTTPEQERICPHCGSDNTRRERYSKRVFDWMMLLFGIPFPAKAVTRLCFDCHREFTIKTGSDKES